MSTQACHSAVSSYITIYYLLTSHSIICLHHILVSAYITFYYLLTSHSTICLHHILLSAYITFSYITFYYLLTSHSTICLHHILLSAYITFYYLLTSTFLLSAYITFYYLLTSHSVICLHHILLSAYITFYYLLTSHSSICLHHIILSAHITFYYLLTSHSIICLHHILLSAFITFYYLLTSHSSICLISPALNVADVTRSVADHFPPFQFKSVPAFTVLTPVNSHRSKIRKSNKIRREENGFPWSLRQPCSLFNKVLGEIKCWSITFPFCRKQVFKNQKRLSFHWRSLQLKNALSSCFCLCQWCHLVALLKHRTSQSDKTR